MTLNSPSGKYIPYGTFLPGPQFVRRKYTKRFSKAYRKERSVAKPWFNNGELATATDFVKNRQKSFGRVTVGSTSNTLT